MRNRPLKEVREAAALARSAKSVGALQVGDLLYDSSGIVVGSVISMDEEFFAISLPNLASDRPWLCRRAYLRPEQRAIGVPMHLRPKTGVERLFLEPQ